jgi:recombination associated protein RdgC
LHLAFSDTDTMFKNALVYRITNWQPTTLAELEARLDTARFAECGATQQESAGWVEPRGEKHAALIESIGGQWMLTLCTETKAVPSSVVKTQLESRLAKVEADTGRRPRGKQTKEIKEAIVHELLPRAFPKRSTTPVWIDPQALLVIVGAASTKKGDAIASRLVELLGGGIVLSLVQTEQSPAVAMAAWLQSKEAPAGFSVDRECELKQPDSEKATVKYVRHTLEIDEVAEHIAQGKVPTQLAMTWNGRVSFVLTEALTLKKIALLDVVLEGATASQGKDDKGFDADVAITTGELGRLVADLLDALGGELRRDGIAPAGAMPPVQVLEEGVAA